MPLPTEKPVSAETVYSQIVSAVQGLLLQCSATKIECQNGSSVDMIVNFHSALRGARALGEAVEETTGLADYAKQAMGDQNYDIVAAFTATLAKGQLVTDWIAANLPNDGNGNYASFTYSDGDFSRIALSSSLLAPLSALIDDLVAAIKG